MILFIDDEKRRMSSYLEACQFAGLEVKLIDDPELGWEEFLGSKKSLDLLILDIMLPTGDRFDRPGSLGGIRTGLELLKDVRKEAPRLPVLLFTQSNDREPDEMIISDPRSYIERKINVLPSELPDLVRKILSENS